VEGTNHFETFDFESLRWLQLHIHNARGPVKVRDIRVRRRVFPWPNQPRVRTNEPELQRLWDACLNTLNNSAQETLVDGMARERQQYSGDGGHQLHGVHLFGADLLTRAVAVFWSSERGLFVNNLRWLSEEPSARTCDRSLATSVLFDQCPGGQLTPALSTRLRWRGCAGLRFRPGRVRVPPGLPALPSARRRTAVAAAG
jgi:alpha-L-rhamnosidase